MLEFILISSVSAIVGGSFAAWRLRGKRTLYETLRAVITGAGGPGPRQK